VVRVRWRPVAVPFRTVLTNAQAAYRVRESVLFEVETAHGLRGAGEASLPAGSSFDRDGPALRAFLAAAAPALPGRQPDAGWSGLQLPAGSPGGWSAAATCAVETALADLAARAACVPLYRWLADKAGIPLAAGDPEIDANGLVDLVAPGPAAEEASSLARAGFRTLKLKVGGDPRTSAATVGAVRAAVGPGVEVRCDANRSWTLDEARSFLAACAAHRVALCEEPLTDPGPRYEFLAGLRAESPVKLAVDESTRTVEALDLAITASATDAVVIKPMASGLAGGLAMVRRARAANLPTIVTTTFDLAPGTAVAMHLAALVASPGPACGLATAHLVEDPLGDGVPEVRHGTVRLSDAPGLGVEFDPGAIERYALGPWEVTG
jgi:L-alanine-DL-glutamate epimerase-like enolase superfamily enzyme